MSDAICATINLLRNTIKNFTCYSLSFAGTSLSAWWADMSVYCCTHLSDAINTKAVTFNAPGSKFIISRLRSMTEKEKPSLSDIEKINIVTYLDVPNVINTVSEHLGVIYSTVGTGPRIRRECSIRNINECTKLIYQELHSLINTFSSRGFSLQIRKALKWPSLIKDNSIGENFPINKIAAQVEWLIRNSCCPVEVAFQLLLRDQTLIYQYLINSSEFKLIDININTEFPNEVAADRFRRSEAKKMNKNTV